MAGKLKGGAGWAVVTGASSGLGAIFADQLAQRGMPLVLAGRDRARLEQVQHRVREAHDLDVRLVVGDLGTPAGVDDLISALGGRAIDVLVNNAGFGTYGKLTEIDAERDHELVRQRRRAGASQPRRPARHAGPRPRRDPECRVDDRVPACAVSGDLRRVEGVRAVVQPGVAGRGQGLGCHGHRAVPRPDPHRLFRCAWGGRDERRSLQEPRVARTGCGRWASGTRSRTRGRRSGMAKLVDGASITCFSAFGRDLCE